MFLAFREIRHAKLRFALIAGIITMVSSLVFILSGLANGLSSGNTAAIDAMPIDAMVLGAGSDYQLGRSSVSADDVPTILGIDGIAAAEPIGVSPANIRKQGNESIVGASFFGIVPGGLIQPEIIEGDGFTDNPNGVVIDETLKNDGIALGDTFTTEPGGVELTVVGITTGQTYSLAPVVFLRLDLWQQVQSTQQGSVQNPVTAILVQGEPDAIAAIPETVPNTMVGSKSQVVDHIPGKTEQSRTLLLIQVFLFVISAGIIAAFFYIITLQKMPELGVMKAIGTGTVYLAQTLIMQVVVLALLGVLIGIVIANVLGLIIGNAVPYRITTQQMAIFGAVLLFVAILGTVLSLIRIARADPLDAINKAG